MHLNCALCDLVPSTNSASTDYRIAKKLCDLVSSMPIVNIDNLLIIIVVFMNIKFYTINHI